MTGFGPWAQDGRPRSPPGRQTLGKACPPLSCAGSWVSPSSTRRCSARDTCSMGSSCPGSRAWSSRAWRPGGCSARCLGLDSNDPFVGSLSILPAALGVKRALSRYRGMHLEDERLYLLLDRYLAGEASAADAEVVREWLAQDAEHAVLLEDLRLIRRVASERAPPTSADAAWLQTVKALGVGR